MRHPLPLTSTRHAPRLRRSPLALAASLCVLSAGALAQPAPAAAAASAPVPGTTTLTITGIRASLEQAAEVKRNAPQVMDVISATDIGKLPDDNVADALQRVTGVQVTRVFGEGQSVSVRGLPLVRVEVDGRTLLGYSARLSPPENEQLGRNSGLDTVPSGLFGRIEVRKSPIASQVEGGLSGSINLVTPKPLDFKKFTASARLQGTYSEGAKKFEPAAQGFVAQQFDDNRIGALLAVDYTQRTTLTQAFERNNFFTRTRIGTGTAPGTSADLNADGQPDVSGDRLHYEQFVVDRSRFGVNGGLQWRPTPNFDILLEGIYSTLKTQREQDFMAWRYINKAITNPSFQDNFIVAGTSTGTLQQAGLYRAEPTVSQLYALSTSWKPGLFTVNTDLSASRGTLDQVIRQITLDSVNRNIPGTFDYRAGVVPSLDLGSFDVAAPANYNISQIRANRLLASMDEKVAKVDVSYSFVEGFLKSIGAGLRYRELDAKSEAFRSQVVPTRAEALPYVSAIDAANFLNGIPGNFPRGFLTTLHDLDYLLQRATGGGPLDRNAARDYDLTEKALAAYVMADFDGSIAGLPVQANVGLRSVRTDFKVTTLAQGTDPVLDTNKYNNLLPSANIVFHLSRDFLVRAAAARTLQQAGIAELAPSLFVNFTNRSATGGNATLTPTLSNNFDLSFELYGGRSALISGAVFYKEVKDVVADNTVLQTFAGFEDLGPIPYTRPSNVGSAKVKGLEFGIQRFFDFLPTPFDGLGIIANYTYSDAKGDGGIPLVGVSKHSYNLIALYEKGPLSARVAYNNRDKAAFSFTQGRPDYVDKRSQLDVQIGWDIRKDLSLQFQAQNLDPKKSATVEYSNIGPVALNSYALSERRYSIGLRAKF
ncbi:MAG: TonB-dependent receptor [Pseudomonadota bacterium]|nr:TonB-dependent receptor [Pseudomonadota bacterium]